MVIWYFLDHFTDLLCTQCANVVYFFMNAVKNLSMKSYDAHCIDTFTTVVFVCSLNRFLFFPYSVFSHSHVALSNRIDALFNIPKIDII